MSLKKLKDSYTKLNRQDYDEAEKLMLAIKDYKPKTRKQLREFMDLISFINFDSEAKLWIYRDELTRIFVSQDEFLYNIKE
jgi:DNA primase large subunit